MYIYTYRYRHVYRHTHAYTHIFLFLNLWICLQNHQGLWPSGIGKSITKQILGVTGYNCFPNNVHYYTASTDNVTINCGPLSLTVPIKADTN